MREDEGGLWIQKVLAIVLMFYALLTPAYAADKGSPLVLQFDEGGGPSAGINPLGFHPKGQSKGWVPKKQLYIFDNDRNVKLFGDKGNSPVAYWRFDESGRQRETHFVRFATPQRRDTFRNARSVKFRQSRYYRTTTQARRCDLGN